VVVAPQFQPPPGALTVDGIAENPKGILSVRVVDGLAAPGVPHGAAPTSFILNVNVTVAPFTTGTGDTVLLTARSQMALLINGDTTEETPLLYD